MTKFRLVRKIVQNRLITKLQIIIFLSAAVLTSLNAQIVPPASDTIPRTPGLDSLLSNSNPTVVPVDSFSFSTPPPDVTYSKDSLDASIEYDARDSMVLDIANEQVHLYGDAVVKYNTMTLTSSYIIFDWGQNIVTAEGALDSVGKMNGFPVFKDQDQNFNAKKIRYNFKNKKGVVYDATTIEKDMYVLGETAVFKAKDKATEQKDDVIYSKNAIITTCSHPTPHFGIRCRKQKVIPNKVAIVGASNLEVGGIPTPIWLPFAFFPLKKGERTGLIFPQDYEYSDEWGFGFRDVGWYFPMGEYWDLTLKGDIYTRGTWGLKASSNYRKRYKFSGNFALGFSDRKREELGQRLSTKSYSLRWSHNQDSKAHPTNQFRASVNIQTNNYQSINDNSANAVFENTLSSNVSFRKRFPGKPFSFTASASHSQNTQNRQVSINLPSVNFQMNRIFPFKRKGGGSGNEKWFEKVSLQYKFEGQNRITATDTTLFSSETFEEARFGIRHTVNSNASFRVMKFFNLTPSVDYKEVWYFNTTEKTFDPELTIDTSYVQEDPDSPDLREVYDTTSYGQVLDMNKFGFQPLRLFNTGINLSTQIFGIRTFSKGPIRGIRHIIKPTVGFKYTPDYTRAGLGYFQTVDTDIRDEFNDPLTYSIFEDGVYDKPSTAGRSMAIDYGFNNVFEGKYWSKRDSTAKNFKFFDNVYVNGSYNFAADSLNWSAIRVTGTTRLFKDITTFNFSTQFDPYDVDEDGRRVNDFYRSTNGKILRYEGMSFRFNSSITVKKLRQMFGSDKTASNKPKATKDNPNPTFGSVETTEDLLGLFENFRISHQLNLVSMPDSFYVATHSLDLSGNIKLTKNWSINLGRTSYNFKLKRLIYPSIGFYRDLHCWMMGMDWYPERNVFSFYLKVRPGTLDFIKVPYQRNNADGFRGF